MNFNGTYTIRNKETGEHRTFRVKTQKDDSTFAPGKRIVALLSGPNNESDYKGFGFVNDDRIAVWTKLRGYEKKSAYDWYAIMLWELATDTKSRWHENYEVLLEKKCIRCNRKLTHPESLNTGVGPECAKRI